MHGEAGMGSLNVEKVERYVGAALRSGVILVVEKDDELLSVLGLRFQSFWWCDDAALMDAFTYVTPEARRTKAFRMMFDKAKSMAEDAKVPLIMANFGPVDEERKSKLFRRLGTPLGTTIISGDTSKFLWN